ncbi:MAG: hypothetical protein IT204_01475 [Fimbriimonadaceae bacterium]|nr:hypothetical protein [Fimbriimonadaceae bacterium]
MQPTYEAPARRLALTKLELPDELSEVMLWRCGLDETRSAWRGLPGLLYLDSTVLRFSLDPQVVAPLQPLVEHLPRHDRLLDDFVLGHTAGLAIDPHDLPARTVAACSFELPLTALRAVRCRGLARRYLWLQTAEREYGLRLTEARRWVARLEALTGLDIQRGLSRASGPSAGQRSLSGAPDSAVPSAAPPCAALTPPDQHRAAARPSGEADFANPSDRQQDSSGGGAKPSQTDPGRDKETGPTR